MNTFIALGVLECESGCAAAKESPALHRQSVLQPAVLHLVLLLNDLKGRLFDLDASMFRIPFLKRETGERLTARILQRQQWVMAVRPRMRRSWRVRLIEREAGN
jgi:hypothetical protein